MTVSSLRQVVSGNFISGLTKIGQQESSGAKIAKTASGQKGPALDVSLRTGAANFAKSLQALNIAISYVNVSRATNEKLLDIVDKLDLLVTKGAKGAVGSQGADLMQLEFQSLSRDFQKSIKDATVRGENVLSSTDLSSVLVRAGLDPGKVESIAEAFKGFASLESDSAATKTDGETQSTRIPVEAFGRAIRQVAAAFGEAVNEGDTSDTSSAFKAVRDQLREIRKTVKGNVDALNKITDIVGQNMKLARAAGLALLDLSKSVKGNEEAESVADELQRRIRSGAAGAVSQASNLNALLVAGVTLSADTFKSK
jgi:hypothetical protein